MELNEFIKQSLTQIAEEVKNSQDAVRELGGHASPAVETLPGQHEASTIIGKISSGQNVFLVDFDVAVTATAAKEKEAGGKLTVLSTLNVGASGSDKAINESTSRIQFKVPLALPLDPETKQALDQQALKNRSAIEAHNRKAERSWKTV